MIFSSSSASSSSDGRRTTRPSLVSLVRPSLPHSAALNSPQRLEFQIIVGGRRETAAGAARGSEGARDARRRVPVAKGRAGSTEERGTRDGAWARITMATGLKFDL